MELSINLRPVAAASVMIFALAVHAEETPDNAAMTPTLDQSVPVAEDVGEATNDATVPRLTDAEILVAQFEKYKQLMSDGVYDEADSVAKRVVELAIRIRGPQSMDFARSLTNLAIVQHRTEQHEAAQQNFQSAIDIIEDNEDRLNHQLLNPLKGLGAAQLESGRPDLAAGTFRRAVHVTHVNDGPHNLDQIVILESLAESNLRLGSIDAAKRIQDTIYAINGRHFANSSLELVPSLMRRAAWQHRAGLIFDERTTYRRVVRIIEEESGKNELALVEPLTNLGQSFFYADLSGTQNFQQSSLTTGEIYFRRALRIATNHPDSNWQILAQSSLALGDYYMHQGNQQRARKIYSGVWELLSEDEAQLELRHAALEQVVALRVNVLPQYVNQPSSESVLQNDAPMKQGKISATYVVSSRGRATGLKIIEAEPPEFEDMQRSVQRELRQRIYRPQFEDAEPVPSSEQLFIHRYYYEQSDLDAIRGENPPAEPKDES